MNSTGSLRVFVVDDNRDAADSLAMLLRIWGHEAHVVYDGAGALAVAPGYGPHVLFIDLAMPKLDGYELAQRLRKSFAPQRPFFVAMTGYADAEHQSQAAAAGFNHFLTKPLELDLLQRLLHAMAQGVSRTAEATALGQSAEPKSEVKMALSGANIEGPGPDGAVSHQ
jgi:CheY-like chemotaxis protein